MNTTEAVKSNEAYCKLKCYLCNWSAQPVVCQLLNFRVVNILFFAECSD